MKIVLVNTVYGTGSVGRIAGDLYEAVTDAGGMAVAAYGRGTAPAGVKAYKIGSGPDFYGHVLRNFVKGEGGFGSGRRTRRFLEFLEAEKPDLLHLHNLHGFYLQVEALFEYLKEKDLPVVWTLHDCWPYTGHCAYYDKNGCEGFLSGCERCPYHASAYPYALFKDNAAESFRRKKRAFSGVDRLTVATPSVWLAGEVKRSFLKEYPVRVVPNGIDLSEFSAEGRKRGKRAKKRALGVANVWEERKGLGFFMELADMLPENYEIELVGLSPGQIRRLSGRYPEERLRLNPRTASAGELACKYREADVFVNPTLEDNFPTVNLEALACGTPVVTFPTGGSPETVDDSCGVCTREKSAGELCGAVRLVCEETDGRRFTPEACRSRAELFDKRKKYREYLELYQEMLKKRTDG